jgi:hypothetical protein
MSFLSRRKKTRTRRVRRLDMFGIDPVFLGGVIAMILVAAIFK